MASFNDAVIEDFGANAGVLDGHWEGKTTLVRHRPRPPGPARYPGPYY